MPMRGGRDGRGHVLCLTPGVLGGGNCLSGRNFTLKLRTPALCGTHCSHPSRSRAQDVTEGQTDGRSFWERRSHVWCGRGGVYKTVQGTATSWERGRGERLLGQQGDPSAVFSNPHTGTLATEKLGGQTGGNSPHTSSGLGPRACALSRGRV